MENPRRLLLQGFAVVAMATVALLSPSTARATPLDVCGSRCVDVCPTSQGEGDSYCGFFCFWDGGLCINATECAGGAGLMITCD